MGIDSCGIIVCLFGLFRLHANLAIDLFGPIPAEHLNPVFVNTACLMRYTNSEATANRLPSAKLESNNWIQSTPLSETQLVLVSSNFDSSAISLLTNT
ncbi:unnamed protein product [Schistosoma margrebowiei]|uniref:Uncharacterized protein n=1 Tax=Schistosoma margrebowiei TaxID=48269 RepID=A0A183LMP6_9TREM|nr:unnamed protein product [Schistosoma margrebowiei]